VEVDLERGPGKGEKIEVKKAPDRKFPERRKPARSQTAERVYQPQRVTIAAMHYFIRNNTGGPSRGGCAGKGPKNARDHIVSKLGVSSGPGGGGKRGKRK